MSQLHPRLFDLLAITPGILRALAEGSERRSLDGEWGPVEIAAHLLDVEEGAMIGRIRRIVEEDAPAIASIDPAQRLKDAGFDRRAPAEVLDEFARRRGEDIAWVRSLPAHALDRTGTHDVIGVLTAAQVANYWLAHDLAHLRQALEGVRQELVPYVGAMVRFYQE